MEYQEPTVTFDEWRSAGEEKGEVITTSRPGGETNTGLNTLPLMTTRVNTAHRPGTMALDRA